MDALRGAGWGLLSPRCASASSWSHGPSARQGLLMVKRGHTRSLRLTLGRPAGKPRGFSVRDANPQRGDHKTEFKEPERVSEGAATVSADEGGRAAQVSARGAAPSALRPATADDAVAAASDEVGGAPQLPRLDVAEVQSAVDRALDSPESKELLRDLAAAEERVARARRELEEVGRQERQLKELLLEIEAQEKSEAKLACAEEEIDKLQSKVSSAEEEVRLAGAALIGARAGSSAKWDRQGGHVDEGLEKVESVKAAAVSAVAGVAAYAPLLLSHATQDAQSLLFDLLATALSCAVLAVTYRYAVRRDVGNVQLKSGVVAAFALTQGLSRLSSVTNTASFDTGLVLPALSACVEEAVALLAAALCLEACLQAGLVQRFPSSKE